MPCQRSKRAMTRLNTQQTSKRRAGDALEMSAVNTPPPAGEATQLSQQTTVCVPPSKFPASRRSLNADDVTSLRIMPASLMDNTITPPPAYTSTDDDAEERLPPLYDVAIRVIIQGEEEPLWVTARMRQSGRLADQQLDETVNSRLETKAYGREFELLYTRASASVRGEHRFVIGVEGPEQWAQVDNVLLGWQETRPNDDKRVDVEFMYKEKKHDPVWPFSTTRQSATSQLVVTHPENLEPELSARDCYRRLTQKWRCEDSACKNKGRWCWKLKHKHIHYKLGSEEIKAWSDAISIGDATVTAIPIVLYDKLMQRANPAQVVQKKTIASCCPSQVINIYNGCGSGQHAPSLPQPRLMRPRDHALLQYINWQKSNYAGDFAFTESLDEAYNILKEHGFAMDSPREEIQAQELVQIGMKLGIAKVLIRDVKAFSRWLNTEEESQYAKSKIRSSSSNVKSTIISA